MPTTNSRWGRVAWPAALAGVLAVALVVPIPTLSDHGRERVSAQVSERLPGWDIERVHPSWEGAYTVVTSCANRHLGFQFVPGHGLDPEDAWLHPNDSYARVRLGELSDDRHYLVWYENPKVLTAYACSDVLALDGVAPEVERIFD